MEKLNTRPAPQDPEPVLLTKEPGPALCTHTHLMLVEKDVSVGSFLSTKIFLSVILLSVMWKPDFLI